MLRMIGRQNFVRTVRNIVKPEMHKIYLNNNQLLGEVQHPFQQVLNAALMRRVNNYCDPIYGMELDLSQPQTPKDNIGATECIVSIDTIRFVDQCTIKSVDVLANRDRPGHQNRTNDHVI